MLNLNDRTLTENLANDNFVNVFDVLIKSKTPARPEDTPYLGDNNLGIEILAQELRGHNHIKRPVRKLQIRRIPPLKAQPVAVLGGVRRSGPQIRRPRPNQIHGDHLVPGREKTPEHTLQITRSDPEDAEGTAAPLRRRVRLLLVRIHPVDRVRRRARGRTTAEEDRGGPRGGAEQIAAREPGGVAVRCPVLPSCRVGVRPLIAARWGAGASFWSGPGGDGGGVCCLGGRGERVRRFRDATGDRRVGGRRVEPARDGEEEEEQRQRDLVLDFRSAVSVSGVIHPAASV